jgi:hypothetical protein
MKSLPIIAGLIITQSLWAQAKPPLQARFRDAVTHERLVSALQQSSKIDPMKGMEPSNGADPSTVNRPVNLLEQSDIICFGDLATLVPKRAILATPAHLKERLALKAGVRLVGWSEFYSNNRGWINTVEVSRVQAEGKEPFSEDTQDSLAKSTSLTIATFMGGPISVLPLKKVEETVTTSATP